jgi:hypothetical protein
MPGRGRRRRDLCRVVVCVGVFGVLTVLWNLYGLGSASGLERFHRAAVLQLPSPPQGEEGLRA